MQSQSERRSAKSKRRSSWNRTNKKECQSERSDSGALSKSRRRKQVASAKLICLGRPSVRDQNCIPLWPGEVKTFSTTPSAVSPQSPAKPMTTMIVEARSIQ